MKKIIPKDKKHAAALLYDSSRDAAPVVKAAGQGLVAERIIEKALQNDVPVLENIGLSQMLQALSVGDAIPPKLYEAVAQIFVYIFQIDQDYHKR